jgi:hypothetical protein
MKAKELEEMSPEERQAFYQEKIAEHTPPKNANDKFIVGVYRSLLEHGDELAGLA